MIIPLPPILLAGEKLSAGLGIATVIADMDFETYSPAGFVKNGMKWDCPKGTNEKGLSVVGAAVYSEHPDAEVLSLAWDLKDGRGPQHWIPEYKDIQGYMPWDLFEHLSAGGLIEAWNVSFEYLVWTNICVLKYGFPPLNPKQLRCAAAKARAHALPGGLDPASEVLDLRFKKDKDGKRLIGKFCIPRTPTKNDGRLRIRPEEDSVDAQKFYDYNVRDIQSEAEASSLTPDLSPNELEFWQIDQDINRRGVQIDEEGVESAIVVMEQVFAKYDHELSELTDGAVPAASELPKLKTWLESQGYPFPSLTEEILQEALRSVLPPKVMRALEIRALASSASVKKLYAMQRCKSYDGRLRGLYIYHSARTGRAAGQGPQPQNLPKSGPEVSKCTKCGKYSGYYLETSDFICNCPWCAKPASGNSLEWNSLAVEDALEIISSRNLWMLQHYFGNAFETISGCLRGLIVAKPGHELICSDYNSIEAVVLAVLAGEQWRIDVFKTHGKIYEMGASLITGTPFLEYLNYRERTGQHHPDRNKFGKISELASGFGGGLGSWKNFGADKYFSDEEIEQHKKNWRRASPKIVELWGGQRRNWRDEIFGLEGAALNAIFYPGKEFAYRYLTYLVHKDVLYCRLPSGRYLTYHQPRLEPGKYSQYQITYTGWNTNPKNGRTNAWIRLPTRGPILTENAVQAVARDIFMHGMRNLEHAGYPIVLHTHDEPVAEVPIGFGSIEEFERLMTTLEDWAVDFPIRASNGWRGHRYRKD